MKSVDQHLAEILSVVGPLGEIHVGLLDAHGCLLAEEVSATTPLPAYDGAAVDGYAVRTSDVATASGDAPVRLHVVGDITPAAPPDISVQPGLCARIVAGSQMPFGADSVVPTEWTDGGLAQVRISRAGGPGTFVRRSGAEIEAGQTVLARGALLGAAQLGLLAAVNRRSVLVQPKPRVVVVSVGSHLVDVGDRVAHGQQVDANSYALLAAAQEAGALGFRAGIVADEPKEMTNAFEDHLIQADAVVTTGSSGTGSRGVVASVLGRLGSVSFAPVAMSPVTVHGFGTIGPDETPVFSLPDDPHVALLSFEVFVRPALRRMLGSDALTRPQVTATITEPLRSTFGERHYVRVRVEQSGGGWRATPVEQGSHALAGMAVANGLAVVPEHATEVSAGTPLTTWLLERRGR